MWAITSYFNPENFQSRLSNYKIFREKLNVPLITIELAFDGQFQLKPDDAEILLQIPNGAKLWQKERLLNLALKKIPKSIENIAWIDCDIFFESQDWHKKAVAQLKNNNVIQLFSDVYYLKPGLKDRSKKNILGSQQGLVASQHASKIHHESKYDKKFHPGLAWAAKKKLLNEHRLYDSLIIGGGDSALSYALYGKYEASKKHHFLSDLQFNHYLNWAQPFYKSVDNKVSFVDEKIYHLWHGKIKNRRYFSRNKALKKLGFNPYLDITLSKEGVWEWSNADESLKLYLENYFKSRKEDDLAL
jgi:hypothetical protein